ncbi:MAG TPA: hypothetical protein VE591_13260 [Candidatus Acidoferrum sp.]|nr:hypothetical protein [Candidatus Acidoferrum sp.]
MRLGVALSVLALSVTFGAPATADQPGYLVTVVGRVVSVDRAKGMIVLHHGMLETAEPADERCSVPTQSLRFVRRGMDIWATADTRRHPWRLRDVRPLHIDQQTLPSSQAARLADASEAEIVPRIPAGDSA